MLFEGWGKGRAYREVHVDDTDGQVCGSPILSLPPRPDRRILGLKRGHNLQKCLHATPKVRVKELEGCVTFQPPQ